MDLTKIDKPFGELDDAWNRRADLAAVPAQVKVLAMRDAGYDTPTDPCDAVIARLVEAAEALGAMPEGYCFCSAHRIGDDSKVHEPECADLRAALAAAKDVLK